MNISELDRYRIKCVQVTELEEEISMLESKIRELLDEIEYLKSKDKKE